MDEQLKDTMLRIESKLDAVLFYLDQLTNEELVLLDQDELKDGE